MGRINFQITAIPFLLLRCIYTALAFDVAVELPDGSTRVLEYIDFDLPIIELPRSADVLEVEVDDDGSDGNFMSNVMTRMDVKTEEDLNVGNMLSVESNVDDRDVVGNEQSDLEYAFTADGSGGDSGYDDASSSGNTRDGTLATDDDVSFHSSLSRIEMTDKTNDEIEPHSEEIVSRNFDINEEDSDAATTVDMNEKVGIHLQGTDNDSTDEPQSTDTNVSREMFVGEESSKFINDEESRFASLDAQPELREQQDIENFQVGNQSSILNSEAETNEKETQRQELSTNVKRDILESHKEENSINEGNISEGDMNALNGVSSGDYLGEETGINLSGVDNASSDESHLTSINGNFELPIREKVLEYATDEGVIGSDDSQSEVYEHRTNDNFQDEETSLDVNSEVGDKKDETFIEDSLTNVTEDIFTTRDEGNLIVGRVNGDPSLDSNATHESSEIKHTDDSLSKVDGDPTESFVEGSLKETLKENKPLDEVLNSEQQGQRPHVFQLFQHQTQQRSSFTANQDFISGLDDFDKFIENVEPPDELDVSAAGMSMQEVLVQQGITIVLNRIRRGIDKLNEVVRKNIIDRVPLQKLLKMVQKTKDRVQRIRDKPDNFDRKNNHLDFAMIAVDKTQEEVSKFVRTVKNIIGKALKEIRSRTQIIDFLFLPEESDEDDIPFSFDNINANMFQNEENSSMFNSFNANTKDDTNVRSIEDLKEMISKMQNRV